MRTQKRGSYGEGRKKKDSTQRRKDAKRKIREEKKMDESQQNTSGNEEQAAEDGVIEPIDLETLVALVEERVIENLTRAIERIIQERG
jgi:hypothetical protein